MINSNLTQLNCGLCVWCQSKTFCKTQMPSWIHVCVLACQRHITQQLTKPSTEVNTACSHSAAKVPASCMRSWQHLNINRKVFLSIFQWALMVEFLKACVDTASWFTHNLLYLQPHTFLLRDVRLPSTDNIYKPQEQRKRKSFNVQNLEEAGVEIKKTRGLLMVLSL